MEHNQEVSSESDISVILCAYTLDRWHDLIEAIASVRRQSYAAREIIVVIDHNPALLKRMQEEISGVVAVENPGSPGLSAARNAGVAIARSSIVAFLDDDAQAAPDWLKTTVFALADPNVMGVGGAIIPHWVSGRPEWFPEEFYWVIGCSYRGLPLSPEPVRNLIGANMVMRREIFEVIGGFREGIGRVGSHPLGCEETELCIRASQRWPERVFLYHPDTSILHRVPTERARWRYFCSRCYAEGLSKAQIGQFVGVKASLAAELTYVSRTLLSGIFRHMIQAIRERSLSGLSRSWVLVAGFAITLTGYVHGKLFLHRSKQKIESFSAREQLSQV